MWGFFWMMAPAIGWRSSAAFNTKLAIHIIQLVIAIHWPLMAWNQWMCFFSKHRWRQLWVKLENCGVSNTSSCLGKERQRQLRGRNTRLVDPAGGKIEEIRTRRGTMFEVKLGLLILIALQKSVQKAGVHAFVCASVQWNSGQFCTPSCFQAKPQVALSGDVTELEAGENAMQKGNFVDRTSTEVEGGLQWLALQLPHAQALEMQSNWTDVVCFSTYLVLPRSTTICHQTLSKCHVMEHHSIIGKHCIIDLYTRFTEAKGGIILVYQSRWAQPRLHYRFSEATDKGFKGLDLRKPNLKLNARMWRNNIMILIWSRYYGVNCSVKDESVEEERTKFTWQGSCLDGSTWRGRWFKTPSDSSLVCLFNFP